MSKADNVAKFTVAIDNNDIAAHARRDLADAIRKVPGTPIAIITVVIGSDDATACQSRLIYERSRINALASCRRAKLAIDRLIADLDKAPSK
jgi:hypothetical protein